MSHLIQDLIPRQLSDIPSSLEGCVGTNAAGLGIRFSLEEATNSIRSQTYPEEEFGAERPIYTGILSGDSPIDVFPCC